MARFQPLLITAPGVGAVAAVLFVIPMTSVPAATAFQGDWDAGSDVFDTYCSDCHSISPKGTNRKGPTLYQVMGRRAGSVPGFEYSAGMRSSGIVWNPATLNAYLANPRATIPDGKMKKGLPKAADRANVITFLGRPD